MAQTKQFESVIRRVKKDIFPSRASEKRIVIDNDSGKSVQKPSWMGGYTYYIVSNSDDTRNIRFTSSIFPIMDDRNRKVDLSIECLVSCNPDNESLVAESLHHPNAYTGNVLDNFIETWVWNFVQQQGPASFIDTFFQNRENLRSYLSEQAKLQTGLNFYAVKCLVEGESDLETINIGLQEILLCYSDSVTEDPYSVEITLLIDPDNKINAIARAPSKSQFEQIIKGHLKEFFFNQVRLIDLYKDREEVESRFKTHLDALLRPYGRHIGAILLKRNKGGEPDETLKLTITVPIDVPEYPNSVTVENQVLIKKYDPARYNANKPEDLNKWLKENVYETVTDVYFGLRYDAIIADEKKLKEDVEKTLRFKVEGIGYKLDHFIIIPALKELEILERIGIKINSEFVTQDYQKVKLEVSIKAQGDRYSPKIKQYINDISTLPAGMETAVLDEITKYVRQISSEYFYENFDSDKNPQAITVRGRLRRLISGKLKDGFDAQILYLSFDIGETEKIRKMEDLKKGWHKFTVDIESRADFRTSSFSGSFRVQNNALGLWDVFQSQEFSIEDIKNKICESLIAGLGAVPSGELVYQDREKQADVELVIRQTAVKAVRETFGLTIAIGDIRMTNGPEDYVLTAIRDLEKRIVLAIADGDFTIARELEENLDFLKKRAGFKPSLPSAEQSTIEPPMIDSRLESRNGDRNEN